MLVVKLFIKLRCKNTNVIKPYKNLLTLTYWTPWMIYSRIDTSFPLMTFITFPVIDIPIVIFAKRNLMYRNIIKIIIPQTCYIRV